MVYNSAAGNANCAASECNSKTPSDVTACCSARAKCSSVFANPECIPNDKLSWGGTPGKDGWTRVKTPNGVGQNGFAYHPGAAQGCSSGDMWGTTPMAACEYAQCPNGYTSNTAGIKYLGKTPNPADLVPVGWDPYKPSDGSPDGWYYADTCPCKSTFCGKSDSGIGYNSAAANALCAGTACSSSTASDVTACCKTRATCSTIASKSGFCGAGKYNSAAANVLCAGTACASPADVGACCTAPAAKCSSIYDPKDGSGGKDNFCQHMRYNIAASDKPCAGNPCQMTSYSEAVAGRSTADMNTCCASAVTCNTIKDVASVCGTGKVYNANAAMAACTTVPCSKEADGAKCCRSA